MSARLAVNSVNELEEFPRQESLRHHPVLVVIAKIISYLFHPIFVPVYIVFFLLFIHPFIFAGFGEKPKMLALAMSFMMYSFFPMVTVLLLRGLKFIDSIQLHTQKDRIIPLIACMTWYFWVWYVWHNLPEYPKEAVMLTMAIFISSILALMANIKMKISLHAIAVGILLAFMITLALGSSVNFGLYLSASLLIAGLVCTARLIASNHTSAEVYTGLAAGILAQLIANVVS